MRRLMIIVTLALLPLMLKAQQHSGDPAILVADQVFITQDRTLVAQGNVEAFQGQTRLRARAIRYNQQSGALEIEGPITISEGDDTLILADAAELEPDLQNGLLRGARLILDQQLQLAAQQIDRVDGRYSQLYKSAVTSCKVCQDGRPPLWQIRAKRVIHDQLEQQLYFDEASFRIRNVPIFYLPRLRLPDPTLERATGFLQPSLRTTSQLGAANRKMHLGYRNAELNAAIPGQTIRARLRGHEFHYATILEEPDAPLARITDSNGLEVPEAGSVRKFDSGGVATGTFFHMIGSG